MRNKELDFSQIRHLAVAKPTQQREPITGSQRPNYISNSQSQLLFESVFRQSLSACADALRRQRRTARVPSLYRYRIFPSLIREGNRS